LNYFAPVIVVQQSHVPAHLFKIPSNYREHYKKEKSIKCGQWKKQH